MGLSAYEIEVIAGASDRRASKWALSLGHPDILATPEELKPFVGKLIPIDNAGVRATRKPTPDESIIGAAKPVFEAMGYGLTVIDSREVYGVDRIVDLNHSIQYYGYDLVVDPGTCEHIFDVAQALRNVAEAVRLGGLVYHMVPLCNFNHGFWNFSPVTFTQFYGEQNGFEILQLRGNNRGNWVDVHPYRKFKMQNDGIKLSLMCLAKKVREVEITFPALQSKYV